MCHTLALPALRTLTDALLLNRQWCATGCKFARTPAPISNARNNSSKRWLTRQTNDPYTKRRKVENLKSRAAIKLIEINGEYKIFKPGQTVVDLGFAPGSWSQVAVDCTKPNGRVIGVDIIPAPPPAGVSTIQGNFLNAKVQELLRNYLSDPDRGRPRKQVVLRDDQDSERGVSVEEIEDIERGYIDRERREERGNEEKGGGKQAQKNVDVVLSDMWEPWPQLEGYWKRSLSMPYNRLMNTSGTRFRDHSGSMDLCQAALEFCIDVLKPHGSFVCKFYQGSEDQTLEDKLKSAFEKVHRVKPDSSRKESREMFFVALRMKRNATKDMVRREGENGAESFKPCDPWDDNA
ncbi:2' O-ribose methyltransferase [Rhizina undulata]